MAPSVDEGKSEPDCRRGDEVGGTVVAELPDSGDSDLGDCRSYTKGLQCYWRTDFVNDLSDELIDHQPEWGQKLPSMHSTMHMYPIDGRLTTSGPAAPRSSTATRNSQR